MKGTELYRRKQPQFLMVQKGCKIPTWRYTQLCTFLTVLCLYTHVTIPFEEVHVKLQKRHTTTPEEKTLVLSTAHS